MSLSIAPKPLGGKQALTFLTPRWTALRHHDVQEAWKRTKARFNVVPAGRRSGKSEIGKRRAVKFLFRPDLLPHTFPARVMCAAPTHGQAKRIFWNDIKALIPPKFIKYKSESELYIELLHGAQIHVIGLDKPERVEGSPWDYILLDEYGNMKKEAWSANIRPALSDRKGRCDFIGVPEGRNHYYDLYEQALADTSGEWAAFHWISADILDPDEIASAKRDLDPLVYQQEYEASFVNFQGRAYYNFDERIHLGQLEYDPEVELCVCLDFNVSPGIAVICQEQLLPNGRHGTGVISEIYVPRNSNTQIICDRFLQTWGMHAGRVTLFGDASGGNRGTAKLSGSDWDIIKGKLRPAFGQRLHFEVPRANPPERSRVNAVNSRLLNAADEVRLMVDPEYAPKTVRDLAGVRVVDSGSGEIDKDSDPALTHLSDALGYYISRRYPVVSNRTEDLDVANRF